MNKLAIVLALLFVAAPAYASNNVDVVDVIPSDVVVSNEVDVLVPPSHDVVENGSDNDSHSDDQSTGSDVKKDTDSNTDHNGNGTGSTVGDEGHDVSNGDPVDPIDPKDPIVPTEDPKVDTGTTQVEIPNIVDEPSTDSEIVDNNDNNGNNGNSNSGSKKSGSKKKVTSLQIGGTVEGASTFIFNGNLGRFMTNSDVVELQARLRTLGYFTYPTNTGYFGPFTQAAVEAYQAANGISTTGFVGPLTRAALNAQM